MMTIWVCLGFAALLIVMIGLDVGVITRKPRAVTPGESAISAALWVLAAAFFSFLLLVLYRHGAFGLAARFGAGIGPEEAAHRAWAQFVAAYATELALSIDNIAVIAVMFSYYQVKAESRARALFWLILVCLLLRGAVIFGAGELLHLPAIRWLFAGLLLLAMVREMWLPDGEQQLGRRLLMRLVQRLPVGPPGHEHSMLVREHGRWKLTPLALAFIASAVGDLSFSIDSLPAAFAATPDPLIAFAANVLAVMALRSMYFTLAPWVGRFRFMKFSLVAIFLWLGWKLGFGRYDLESTLTSLGVVVGLVALGAGASAIHHRRTGTGAPAAPRPSPISDLSEAAALARRNLWKIVILIAGTAVILFGIAIAPLPGPGPTVLVPMGLVILASEFVWAQRLLKIFKEKSEALARQGDKVGALFPRWALIPIVMAFYGFFSLLLLYRPVWPMTDDFFWPTFVNATCFGLSIPFLGWVLRTGRINVPFVGWLINAGRQGPGREKKQSEST